MFRPVTITHPVVVNDGKPFEAMSMELSFHRIDQDLYITDYDDDKNDFIFHQSLGFMKDNTEVWLQNITHWQPLVNTEGVV